MIGGELRGDGQGDAAKEERAGEVYESAVAGGFYRRDAGGLAGKYDNVRRCWEDRITRDALREALLPLLREKRRRGGETRVLDLGSGSGEGYEIVTGVAERPDHLDDPPGAHGGAWERVTDTLESYLGLDLSEAMVEEGRRIYRDDPAVRFQVRDLSGGLGPVKEEEPAFDVYFSSYGSLSHLRDEELRSLVRDVAEHASGTFLFVADVLGRFSFEWPCYWDSGADGGSEMRPYSMSYLDPPELRHRGDVEPFPIRYWGGAELAAFLDDAFEEGGGEVVERRMRDRSVLVGRHMDTGEFNRHAQPIRSAVNRLHELDHRTDLDSLLFDHGRVGGCDRIHEFYEEFGAAWNRVVRGAKAALAGGAGSRDDGGDDGASAGDGGPFPSGAPAGTTRSVVRESIETVRHAVEHVKGFRMGDPRANVIEPQLGFVLKDVEAALQQGLGAAHGLLAIYRVDTD